MKRWLGWPSIVAAILAAIFASAIYLQASSRRDRERERQDYLRREIAKLDIEIEEIKQLRPMIAEVLSRKTISEALGRDRPEAVQLLNELTRRRPEGVRFVSVRFGGRRAWVEGVAASEQVLRDFISAIAVSAVLEAPQALTMQGREFSFEVAVRRAGGA
jgi:type IV pilus assembly protein PilN